MKLITFAAHGGARLGILDEAHGVLDVAEAGRALLDRALPDTMLELIEGGEAGQAALRELLEAARQGPSGGGTAPWRAASGIRLLAPIPRPRKNVFCVGRNYRAHVIEGARARGVEPKFPEVPEFFSKPPTAVIGHEDDIRLDERLTQNLDYEVELAVVVGRRVRDLRRDEALGAVFGYTIVNDITARDLQRRHNQWFKGKGLDTGCPMGPCIVTADEFGDPAGHRIALTVNGELRQNSNTADMIFPVAEILSVLSAGLTLEPGDVVATGTPEGVALGMTPQPWLRDGDVIEAEIEGIGRLRNRVVRAAA